MKKNHILFIISIILIVMMCSGCQQTGTQSVSKITLESDVVELVYSNLTFQTKYEFLNRDDPYPTKIIEQADASYLFHNIAGRDIFVKVTAIFYDKDNNVIGGGGPKTIQLFDDYTEQSITPVNTISYKGEGVEDVDHVKIIAEET